jgi:hypothetical protein
MIRESEKVLEVLDKTPVLVNFRICKEKDSKGTVVHQLSAFRVCSG